MPPITGHQAQGHLVDILGLQHTATSGVWAQSQGPALHVKQVSATCLGTNPHFLPLFPEENGTQVPNGFYKLFHATQAMHKLETSMSQ